MQTRFREEPDLPLLEAVLRDPRAEMHQRIADVLWDSESDEQACERLRELGREIEPVAGGLVADETSNG